MALDAGLMKFQSPFTFPRVKPGFTRPDYGRLTDELIECGCGGNLETTVSTHFCPRCGAAFDYWGMLPEGRNEAWRKQEKIKDRKGQEETLAADLLGEDEEYQEYLRLKEKFGAN